jgi:hypothetical protein
MNQEPFLSKRGWLTVAVLAGSLVLLGFVWWRWPGQGVPHEPPASVKPSLKGWQIRYNATLALCVRGSKKVPLDVLGEMLDENKQLKNFRVKVKAGQDVPDENSARKTILNALKAITAWHEKLDVPGAYGADNPSLKKLYASIDELAKNSPNAVVRTEALRAKNTLFPQLME